MDHCSTSLSLSCNTVRTEIDGTAGINDENDKLRHACAQTTKKHVFDYQTERRERRRLMKDTYSRASLITELKTNQEWTD
ncbi:hypothetical protein HDU99_001497, partial [Rhizoclosmatium hyalinum]